LHSDEIREIGLAGFWRKLLVTRQPHDPNPVRADFLMPMVLPFDQISAPAVAAFTRETYAELYEGATPTVRADRAIW